MKILSANRLFALSVASILVLAAAAPAASAMAVPFPQPVYVNNCVSSTGPITGTSNILVFFNLNNQNQLNEFLNNAYYNPLSPSYHNFMSASQFDAQYSPPWSVVNKVQSILTSAGLHTLSTAPMLIEATGTYAQVTNALATLSATNSIQHYIIGAECMPQTYNIQSNKNSYPASYSPDDARGTYVGSSPLSSGSKSGTSSCTYQDIVPGAQIWLPCGLQTIYDETPLLQQSSSPWSHQTIALVDAFGDPDPVAASSLVYSNLACSDLATFDTTFSLPNNGCSVIYPTGTPTLTAGNVGDAEGWATETMIDMEYSHTMAPQAHILEVTSSTDYDDLYTSIEYVVNHQLANMISLSWGSWEDLFYYPPSSAAFMLGYHEIFEQAAAQGIGVFVSSGDFGAFDPVLGEVAASSPATDPWVSAVGGTTLTATFTGQSVSRLETAWSLGSDSYNPVIATGGGFSMVFEEPLGQELIHISTQVPSIPLPALGITFYPQGMRGEPDLAADGDPSTGVLVVVDGSFSPFVWGGTSLSAPLTAGMDATIQNNARLFTIGDLAPSLYELYLVQNHGFYVHQSTFSLHELDHGVSGTMFETSSGQNGPFSVTPGSWNPVAGLGQLNVYGLSQLVPFGSFGH
jgi:kumamolisin